MYSMYSNGLFHCALLSSICVNMNSTVHWQITIALCHSERSTRLGTILVDGYLWFMRSLLTGIELVRVRQSSQNVFLRKKMLDSLVPNSIQQSVLKNITSSTVCGAFNLIESGRMFEPEVSKTIFSRIVYIKLTSETKRQSPQYVIEIHSYCPFVYNHR